MASDFLNTLSEEIYSGDPIQELDSFINNEIPKWALHSYNYTKSSLLSKAQKGDYINTNGKKIIETTSPISSYTFKIPYLLADRLKLIKGNKFDFMYILRSKSQLLSTNNLSNEELSYYNYMETKPEVHYPLLHDSFQNKVELKPTTNLKPFTTVIQKKSFLFKHNKNITVNQPYLDGITKKFVEEIQLLASQDKLSLSLYLERFWEYDSGETFYTTQKLKLNEHGELPIDIIHENPLIRITGRGYNQSIKPNQYLIDILQKTKNSDFRLLLTLTAEI